MKKHKTRSLTVQAIQERVPWIMMPTALLGGLLTPQRWAGAVDRSAMWITRLVTRDSTKLGASLVRSSAGMSRLRVRLLTGRPILQQADWTIRKFFWTLIWTSAVVSRLWPKKLRVPREEKKIRLISAPESYSDFNAPSLIVPANLPCSESSLLSTNMLQGAHLFQELLPIISPPQPEASADRRERVRQAFSWMYRIVRTPPHWHDDLVLAEAKGNLLGALATGGPFAKLVARDGGPAQPDRYVIDLRSMMQYPVRPGLCKLGCGIYYTATPAGFRIDYIEYQDKKVYPSSKEWKLTERIALCSMMTHLTVWRHGMQYHVAGIAPIAPLTFALPARHPIRRLLAPHTAETTYTNFQTHLTLRRGGFDVTGFSFSYDTILRYYDDGARNFNITELDVRRSAARRKIPEDIEYPYLRQAVHYYMLFESYVKAYVDHYYPDDAAVSRDRELQLWFDSIDTYLNNGIRGYVPELSKVNLVKLCALYIYAVTVEHEENTQWDYAVFLPSTVRQDGVGQSVGEVQSVVNFQLVISSATNRLLRDITHLALDPEGAAIMRQFQAQLRQLQKSMETAPDKYWQVFPVDLEASVSA